MFQIVPGRMSLLVILLLVLVNVFNSVRANAPSSGLSKLNAIDALDLKFFPVLLFGNIGKREGQKNFVEKTLPQVCFYWCLFRGCVLVDVGVKHEAGEAEINPRPPSMCWVILLNYLLGSCT